MADVLIVTPQPIRISSATFQPIHDAVDVSAYDILDLSVSAMDSPVSGAVVEIWTGMQTQTDDGWVLADSFSSVASNSTVRKTFTGGFLRYIRWRVQTLSSNFTFVMQGMGRCYSRRQSPGATVQAWAPLLDGKTVPGSLGLSAATSAEAAPPPLPATSDAVVVYSTRLGGNASDGRGAEHTPFAAALLDRLAVPEQTLAALLDGVQRDVERATVGRQRPCWTGRVAGELRLAE